MPHFVLDCSESIIETHTEEEIMRHVHFVANSTGLFNESDIKVRVNSFKKYLVGNKKEGFIHVFADIMGGRSVEQKADLSRRIVQKLTKMFPHVGNIAMNVRDFDKKTFCNRDML